MQRTANSSALVSVVVALAVLSAACATLAPGADPLVVRSEQVLKVAPSVYDAGMTWAEANKAKIPASTLVVFEKIRVGFPPAYRAADEALTLYKAKKTNGLANAIPALERMLGDLATLVTAMGGPDIGGVK